MIRRVAFEIVFALAWSALSQRRWLARRINNGGALDELACYMPWLVTSGVGIGLFRVAEALA